MKRVLVSLTNENNVFREFHLTKIKVTPQADKYKQMNKPYYLILTLFFFLFCCVLELYAQEQTPLGFTVGSFVGGAGDQNIYASFDSSSMNTLVHYAHTVTKPYLSDYSVIARNDSNRSQWINHYATSLYSKWEAEENQTNSTTVGIKHKFGKDTTWQGVRCWSTLGLSSHKDSLLYGPHYRQEKEYKRWLYNSGSHYREIDYNVRYRMALHNPYSVNPNEEVCRITVRVRHAVWINGVYADSVANDTLGGPITFKVVDFPPDGSFQDFLIEEYTYLPEYPEQFIDGKLEIPSDDYITYTDSDGENGIEFLVEWLRDDALCNLYVDYVEVYDNYGWNDEIITPGIVESRITQYLSNYPNSEWPNIKYWWSQDEPFSIDAYTPMRIVDSLVRDAGGAPLITEFYPDWHITVNGDSQLVRYYNMVQPQKLMIDYYPFSKLYYPIRPVDLESMREQFQICHTLQPGFWYVAQGFGVRDNATGNWCSWRRPDSSELKATVMLALAHGVKGIMFWNYQSYDTGICGEPGYFECIVGKAPNYPPSELWYLIKENFAPRLKGKLGKTLLSLDYTGNYINKECYNCPNQDNITTDYLTINHYGTNYYWHAGFLNQHNYIDNKYFLLTNLRTTLPVTASLTVENNIGYNNVSFTDIEGGVGRIDTTIGLDSSITYLETMPAGEGRLYRVSPVVLYGGRLIYNEDVGEGQILTDEMTIENGATLTVYGTYTAEANITVKDGNIVNGENGKIIFKNGTKLIIEGTATINGTSGDKLSLNFESVGPEPQNGILINPVGLLTISNCIIDGAETGIKAELYAKYLNAQYVDFVDCQSSSVTILGQMGEGETPPPPQIKYCNISNSVYGISGANLSQIIIQENHITNTDLGIFLSNVTTPAVIGNTITGTSQLAGIFLESCGGVVRSNWISGHTNGIHLGNSAPDIGGNTIENNYNRGLYVGAGSLPNLQGKLVQDPINPNIFYAVSGYNRIKENGGWSPDDDGSEVFINDANVILSKGCNQITDPRIPNTRETPPLYNTQLLMNCSGSQQLIEVHAGGNFWGENPIYPLEERFGDCIVYLDPILNEPCPEPDGSGGKLFITSSAGDIIDTLYAEERTRGTLSSTEQLYASAEEKFLTGDLTAASQIYENIINSNASEEEKYLAYTRKYEIGKLTNQAPEFFNEMGNTFTTLSANSQDSINAKIFNQLSTLCKVGEEEYETSISDFDAVVQQNPNTEEAVYAEIDALTTALLIEGNDSTLNKGSLGKYLIKTSGDYFSRIDGILRKNFGSEKETEEKEIIPEEYTLYQNYPNPFNPITTIKYDLPKAGEVELVVYDILGRKVKTLVNQTQKAGRYDLQFNASSLASGVYIYQLKTKEFVNSKKMILLK